MTSVEEVFEDNIKESEKKDSDVFRTNELLLNKSYWRRKTVLSKSQTMAFSIIDTISEIHDVQWLKTWKKDYTDILTSVKGKGRNDIIEIMKAQIMQKDKERSEMLELLRNRR